MYSTKTFLRICKMTQNRLNEYVAIQLRQCGYKNVVRTNDYVFAKGELPILLVAHLDTVHKKLPCNITINGNQISALEGIGGDDRCGVFIILRLISELKCSVVFCADEEVGGVGATAFTKSKHIKELDDINYIIEFDRRGSKDAVFYDCANDEFVEFIESTKYFKESYGSFSDISVIAPELGVAAVNLSSGYYNAHTVSEYVNVDEMCRIIEEAKKIINTPVNKPFEYVEAVYSSKSYASYYDYLYDDYDWCDGRCYTIMFEGENNELYETEYLAVNENDALGQFFKDNPNMCYMDVVNVYSDADYKQELKELWR